MVHLECITALCDKNILHGPDHLCCSIAAVLWRLHCLDWLPECAASGLCASSGYDNEGDRLFCAALSLSFRLHALIVLLLDLLPVLAMMICAILSSITFLCNSHCLY